MELLIKITNKCNFKCSFCSAAYIGVDKYNDFKDKFYKKLIEINPNYLYIDGGDPLMVDPQIYWDLIDFIKNNNLKTKAICFTTNLWDFYEHPNKWIDLFNHPMIDITTSFQYGNKRISPNGIFTEEDFRKIVKLFKEKVPNKNLGFISVIDDDNEDTWKKTALLAKELNIEFRLNPVSAVGKSSNYFYPRYKMVKIWIEVVKMGLGDLEQNIHAYRLKQCPYNFNCKHTLTCYRWDNGEEKEGSCCIYSEVSTGNPNFKDKTNLLFKNKCLGCPIFDICSACAGQRYQINKFYNQEEKEYYCNKMLELKDDIEKWLK